MSGWGRLLSRYSHVQYKKQLISQSVSQSVRYPLTPLILVLFQTSRAPFPGSRGVVQTFGIFRFCDSQWSIKTLFGFFSDTKPLYMIGCYKNSRRKFKLFCVACVSRVHRTQRARTQLIGVWFPLIGFCAWFFSTLWVLAINIRFYAGEWCFSA